MKEKQGKKLKIFIGEEDKIKHTSLYQIIIKKAHEMNIAGATAYRGITGFGNGSRIRTEKLLDFSMNMPIIIEIVDNKEKIKLFIPELQNILNSADCGGVILISDSLYMKFNHK